MVTDAIKEKEEKEKTHRMQTYSSLLGEALARLGEEKKSLILVFEGLDASGKSGCIKRLVRELDYKSYNVVPVSKPTAEEYQYHYLRRFWKNLPKYGNCTVFDRSWYGRVLVERVEGFCTEAEWRRAYREINEFEKLLFDDGGVIIKFWFDVSPEVQLKRFKERMENPKKQHKITDEDWRNRSARAKYDEAMADMLRLTGTCYAPWYVIDGDDKKKARAEAAERILEWIDLMG